ncbi:MAG: GMC oxidoreductase [Niastella sp.]|uniref:GMC oxidoreductase n=1 Tax=Niastella sp. TaxID=1869183 RepID=UPI003899CD03
MGTGQQVHAQQKHSKEQPDKYDLCIIGAGPAGIILALEYARTNPVKQVVLVEFGSKRQGRTNRLDDSIEIRNTLNHHAPYDCTNKGMGGSSATWGGRCVMYDEIDFSDRPVLNEGCTWPPGIWEEVKKFRQQAAGYFECGRPLFNLNEMQGIEVRPIAEKFKKNDILEDTVVERWSMPTRFGKRYAKEMAGITNLHIMQGCEARNFTPPDKQGAVAGLYVQTGSHREELVMIKAAQFVLAAGAQESTRLLLRNTLLFRNLECTPPALGRYYQGHLSGKIASVRFTGDPGKTDYGFLRDLDGTYLRRRFQFSTSFLKANNLLNTAFWLDNPLYYDPQHRSGAMSFMYLAMLMPILGKKLAPPAIAHSITNGKKTGIGKHLLNILRDLPGSLFIPASIFFRRYCLKRKLPGVFLYSPQNRYALHFHAEQVPYSGNRMKLAGDGETLQISYGLTTPDIDSIIQLHKELDLQLRAMGCGELEYWFPPATLPDAIRNMSKDGLHQCGTTRMAGTPENGVVDANLKLWGTSNIYVCSSSVFPTSGQANPTFLLGVFAVRLAAHLAKGDKVNRPAEQLVNQ